MLAASRDTHKDRKGDTTSYQGRKQVTFEAFRSLPPFLFESAPGLRRHQAASGGEQPRVFICPPLLCAMLVGEDHGTA
eukprot:3942537-Amphidinium_carterae.1